MSFTWGVCIGAATPIPYFYSVFFIVVLIHRCGRDFERYVTSFVPPCIEVKSLRCMIDVPSSTEKTGNDTAKSFHTSSFPTFIKGFHLSGSFATISLCSSWGPRWVDTKYPRRLRRKSQICICWFSDEIFDTRFEMNLLRPPYYYIPIVILLEIGFSEERIMIDERVGKKRTMVYYDCFLVRSRDYCPSALHRRA